MIALIFVVAGGITAAVTISAKNKGAISDSSGSSYYCVKWEVYNHKNVFCYGCTYYSKSGNFVYISDYFPQYGYYCDVNYKDLYNNCTYGREKACWYGWH